MQRVVKYRAKERVQTQTMTREISKMLVAYTTVASTSSPCLEKEYLSSLRNPGYVQALYDWSTMMTNQELVEEFTPQPITLPNRSAL